jgi:hypothetical protein
VTAEHNPFASENDGLRAYFGSVGTCPPGTVGHDATRLLYTRAGAPTGLDFVLSTERAPAPALTAAAALVNDRLAGRFVALFDRSLGADTVEIMDDSCHASVGAARSPGWRLYLNYLNAGFRLAPTAVQSAESRAIGAAAEHRTAVLARALSEAEIADAVRRRRVYASEDRNLRIVFTINGVPLGSALPLSVGTPLRIEVRLADDDEPFAYYRVSLRRDVIGGALEADRELSGTDLRGDGTIVFTQFRRGAADEYFLLQVAQGEDDDADIAWTAPIWLLPAGGA